MASPLSVMGFQLLQLFYVWSGICVVAMTLVHVGTLPASTTASSTFVGNETDRFALLAFKSKILQDPHGVVSSWNNSLHFCEWQGLICGHRHRRVTIIDLTSQGLVGSLSPYVGNLTFLRGLWLSDNTFQGEIPVELGNLFRLQILNLSNNNFEGEIPASLSRCSNLTYLDVGKNKLAGKFPKELTSLPKLTILAIYKNNLTGGISPFIGNLTSLKSFSAARNSFGGSIPDTLGQLKKLTQLGLGGNQLSGMIPPSIYNLSFLNVFSVGFNQLHGSLPPSFGFMFPDLQLLQLNANQFTGTLPLSISNFSKMEQFQVEHNNFNGKITVNFGRLQNLKKIGLFHNNFGSGEPDDLAFIGSLANCSNLEALGMEVNQFRGVLPESVGNLSKNLFAFILGRNQIYGTIPSTIGNLVNLETLGGNRLEGTIPSRLANCKKLLWLNLYQNNLSGNIPKELLKVSSLSISLNLARNRLSGSLPTEVGNLKNLMELDISENRLSGEIPSSLGSCTSLENLYMQENSFQGSIPLSLESLRGIKNFELSHNNLSGKIPTFLEKFSLMILNLSFNDFEGELPMGGVFTNASAISIVGNHRLCGGISELQLPSCITKKSKHKMPLSHILAITAASVLVGAALLSFFTIYLFKKQRTAQSTVPVLKESFLKVSYEKLLKATDGFSSANLIGFGSFGSVYRGILIQDREFVAAIKVLNLQNRGAIKSFMAECETLRNIRHRNLVRIITSCSSVDFHGNEFKALVYEFMPNGSLERWLHASLETNDGQNEQQRLNLVQRINIAIDVACALDYLHHQCQMPIIHCDLKPSNILLDCEMVAHIGDFGLARFFPELTNPNQSSSIGVRGTIGYVAPEYGLGSEMSTYGDVYSFGTLLLEMITGKRPTENMFEEGHNLHNFARMALPDRVMEIADPVLLDNEEEEARATTIQVNNGSKIVECLISMVNIGVACSTESPQGRMSISNILHELHLVKNKLLKDELQTRY
ncbi:hypothetical protein TEA_007476 [Camellia sinensis var. sinensis]|uniref:non-specific serine/threonine protein kinase n=2 Tax=Camellia sinensis TaxID=4442 RepID=A0A4S4EJB2_CAMSN|nr:hypothetical protein TEA_007476 [Camellia sinensis var. sinensis]